MNVLREAIKKSGLDTLQKKYVVNPFFFMASLMVQGMGQAYNVDACLAENLYYKVVIITLTLWLLT